MSIRSMKSIPALTAAAAILALYALSASAAPQVNELAGIWEITGTSTSNSPCAPSAPFVNKVVVSSDGSLTNVDPFFGAAVGRVERLRAKTFALGIFGFVPPPAGLPFDEYEIQATGTAVDADTVSGKFRTILYAKGIPVCMYEGNIEGTRRSISPF